MKLELTEYDIQANNFLESTNTVIKKEYIGTYNRNDFGVRDNYKITITRGSRSINFEYSTSLYASGKYHIIKDNDKGLYKTIYGISHKVMGNRPLEYSIVYDSFKLKNKADKDFTDKWFRDSLQTGYLICVKNANYSEPRDYDILACLQKYPVDSLENFCSDFGYDTDSIKANSLYLAVQKEYMQVASIWNDTELEQLMEIN